MANYQRYNNIIGWLVFIIASVVYILTIEPTSSFWDCGEYIATSYKLMVGHPPGAPMFQLIGRFFSLFAFGDVTKVAWTVNLMSGLSSSFTILFLFWSITMLAKKLVTSNEEMSSTKMFAIFGSGIVGALAYTFSDTFWFSAVEGEVYAMSSFLTAVVFWAMLKWETEADKPTSLRWIVLIAYIMGLSIGVHLLNLLTIPAMVFIYYFKKYKVSPWGFVKTSFLAVILLTFVQNGIIPWIIKLDWLFEKFFVNALGLPFHLGSIFYFAIIIAGIVFGLLYTKKHQKVIANTLILCFAFILIGYSSFFMLVIRSNANTPINENSPTDALGLMAYLGREQYGDWPIAYGPYYNAPTVGIKNGNPVYKKDTASKSYIIIDDGKSIDREYDERFMTIFPRMHGTRGDQVSAYQLWGDIKGTPIQVTQQDGTREVVYRPTFGENLRFFFRYQIGHMYWRYFMWNFAGRQNDIQGHGSPIEGNWLSGITFIDEMRLGPQLNQPFHMLINKANNKYYFLPLILGFIGLFFHLRRGYKDALIVGLLFLMTGFAIILYLNQTPYQPRERDYAYAASFYAFAIWIGLGVFAIINFLNKYFQGKFVAIITIIASLFLVPGIMAKENWDDHDRSHSYKVKDIALNYLESCAPNAILFTNGDNDTFPLWYLQEVEGIRTDVKVCNLSLLNADWYIDNMMRHRTYDAPPIPLTLTPEKYIARTRNIVYIIPDARLTGYYDLRELIDFAADDSKKMRTQSGMIEYIPTNKFSIKVDSSIVVNNGTVRPEQANEIVPVLEWTFNQEYILKNHLIVLDILASNNWERPVYFATSVGQDNFLGLENYFQLEGMAYRLVPFKTLSSDGQPGKVNTEILYDNMMNKFRWGNISDPRSHLMQDNTKVSFYMLRNAFSRLAHELVNENKMDSAIAVLDKCFEEIPETSVPYNLYMFSLVEAYYRAGATEKANALSERVIELAESELSYYFKFGPKFNNALDNDIQLSLGLLQRVFQVTARFEQTEISEKAKLLFQSYYQMYSPSN
ncbi:MAG: DUF2723 domain-containing protein [Bacteroidales bacterium]|nr:DUF2723 domain-containing protein [Bacteroidales bacterium]